MDKRDIKYVVEAVYEGNRYYAFNKRTLLRHADLARKFSTPKLALQFYKSSEFIGKVDNVSVVPYHVKTKQVIRHLK